MTAISYIGLGSNLGDSVRLLQAGLQQLKLNPAIKILAVSSFYRSKPVGPQNQGDYINAVAALNTTLSAEALLDQLLAIEKANGRDREAQVRWGPRTLDLDILLYGDEQIHTERLIIPHPEMTKRSFVIYPLLEIAPALVLANGQPLSDYSTTLSNQDLIKIELNSRLP